MDAAGEIVIPLPRAEVARFVFDLRNAPSWALGVKECRPLTPGPLRPGSRVEQRMKVLGPAAAVVYEVVSMDPERFMETRITDPFEMWMLLELEDVPDGTLVRVRTKRVSGEPGFFRWFGPLLGFLANRNVARDLRSLKRTMMALPR